MGLNLKTTTGKVIASLALVGTAAGVAGLGTYGAFTSSTSASNVVASGTVSIALGASGTANRLSVAASGLVPGDTVQRAVTLSNTAGNQDLSSITLTTSALPTSKLDTDATMGLQLTIDNCSVPWTEAGTSPAYTYTCSGTTTSVLASRPVIGSNLSLSNVTSVAAGQTDNLRVTMTLPSTADNTLQGQSSTVGFNFTGTQRTATNK
ncbi:CalY family protein [Arthrobacter sp. CJ23]|uniref:CalY family protein n=1 Tax=Arthrobacter sp. CJ23 TaxID=2972479 RepID=UPI00215B813E|nr:CalY family protein [Arthrobacter sp. CJ23]UVJ38146.1 CalY family protein [Arthrobacter sp. CJ23]